MNFRSKKCFYIVLFQLFFFVWILYPKSEEKIFQEKLTNFKERQILYFQNQNPISIFFSTDKRECLLEGTLRNDNLGFCICKNNWKGNHCSMPALLPDKSKKFSNLSLVSNGKARRIILVVLYDYSEEILEMNLNNIGDLINGIILGDSLSFFVRDQEMFTNKIKSGWLKEHIDKLVHVALKERFLNMATAFDVITENGLHFLSDVHPNDILIFLSSDEIISREIVLFLKLFDHYPLPASCMFDHYLYGFFWKIKYQYTTIQPCVVSVIEFLNNYNKKYSNLKKDIVWYINGAGWKCVNCMSPYDIHNKLLNLSPELKPKWFVNDSHKTVPHILESIKNGLDVNEKKITELGLNKDIPVAVKDKNIMYLLENPFKDVLINDTMDNYLFS